MTLTTTIRIAAAGLVGAAILSPVALAGGEPKNDWPFTRSVGERAPALVQSSSQQVGVGEPKNELPFTRPVSDAPVGESAPSVGEAKNELPFTGYVSDGIRSGNGFDWGDAGIGVAAGVGLAVVLAGALILASRGPRSRRIGAAMR